MTPLHSSPDFDFVAATTRCTPEQLLNLWRMTRIEVRAALPQRVSEFDSGPSLPGRIRGALGHALRVMSGEGESSLALQAFFGPLPLWRPRAQVPRPYAITADQRGREIFSTLLLFGRIDVERERLIEAFPLAFEIGLAVDSRSFSRRVPLQVVSASWTMTQSIAPFLPSGDAMLLFRTPFRIGAKDRLSGAWDHLIVSLVERVAGMALWQGVDIDLDLGAWRRRAQELCFDDRDLLVDIWDRRSGREQGKLHAMSGYRGCLIVNDPPEALLPYLALGETTFVGGHAAFGLGRYDLISR